MLPETLLLELEVRMASSPDAPGQCNVHAGMSASPYTDCVCAAYTAHLHKAELTAAVTITAETLEGRDVSTTQEASFEGGVNRLWVLRQVSDEQVQYCDMLRSLTASNTAQ